MKNYKTIGAIIALTVGFVLIFYLIPSVTIIGAAILVVMALGVAISYVLILRRKDELQQQIIQKSMASTFLSMTACYLALTIFEFFLNLDVELHPWIVVVTSLLTFASCLFLTRLDYRGGSGD